MIKIDSSNYDHYKHLYEILCTELELISRFGPDSSPINFLTRLEEKSKSLAIKSLKIGLNDMFVWIKDLPERKRDQINNAITKAGFPDLIHFVNTINVLIAKVIKRKRVRNEEEYYLIKEFICDIESKINSDERKILERLIFEFEFKNKNSKD